MYAKIVINKAVGEVISGIISVDKRLLLLVDGIQGNH